MHKVLRLGICQGDGLPHHQGRVSVRKIILNGHSHAAGQVVDSRDGFHIQRQIPVNFLTVEKLRHRLDRVFAAQGSASVSLHMGIGNLAAGGTHILPILVIGVYLCHGVAVDGQLGIGFMGLIHNQQIQRITLSSDDIVLRCLSRVVNAHKEVGAQVFLWRTGNPIDLHRPAPGGVGPPRANVTVVNEQQCCRPRRQ